jgi:hypothetical protein
MFLKQSTAYTFRFGPFLDDTDGKTAETGLTISQADVRLSKNGGNFAQKNESSSSSHDEIGYYIVVLDTTDTNTVGELLVAVHESGALPVFKTLQVVEEAIYDAVFAASATLVTKIDAIDTVVDAVKVVTDAISTNGSGLSAIPWNSSWDAEVQSEVADGLAAYDPPTKAEMDAMWTTAATESYASDGAAATPAQLLYMILCSVSEFAISSTTITGKKLDGSTTAMTWTIDDASNPTSRTRAS